ncbi:response regulator transcription factor [Streptomyces sp. 5-8]|uniref:Response regulator transcription factor n=1 Tax=Streptomyces musisoli TaxID=2802280 RepID=A0ABS1P8S9_9ACTN|nr:MULTISPECIES: response regulator transcription factor [Streptomyces]MBL1108781.1 response regulator transcription factor [Streptomyces musisoli]MBY8842909.1 response regulator transcription factor [Streptomyces sp. SP2-10]
MTTPNPARITVVIADDHPLFREGISRALQLSGTIDVIAEAENGRDALDIIRREQPDIAVLDLRMPELDGIAVLHALTRDNIPTRVLLLSAFTESASVYQAIEEGAAGYLTKDTKRSEIISAIHTIHHGQTVVPPDVTTGLAEQIRKRRTQSAPTLTAREQQVLQAIARGLSTPQIAQELFLGASTVKTHTQHLYEKLNVTDRAQAVAEAMRRGLLE